MANKLTGGGVTGGATALDELPPHEEIVVARPIASRIAIAVVRMSVLGLTFIVLSREREARSADRPGNYRDDRFKRYISCAAGGPGLAACKNDKNRRSSICYGCEITLSGASAQFGVVLIPAIDLGS
jgi:hypothetical protein